MNFVIIPALIGPLLGPTVGGLIVHWLSWREIFFVNVPMGIAALWIIHRHMPDYRGDAPRPLDVVGLVLFGTGTALLSWLLEIFGEHSIDADVGRRAVAALARPARAPTPGTRAQVALSAAATVAVRGAHLPRLGGRRLRHAAGHRRPAVPAAAALPAGPGPAGMGVGPADDAGRGRGDGHEVPELADPAPLRLPPGAGREHGADRRHHLHCSRWSSPARRWR